LHLACRGGHRNLVQYLLAQDGVSIHALNNKGRTPFQEAAAGGHRDMELLLPPKPSKDEV
jgi:ankyrin repeat protein